MESYNICFYVCLGVCLFFSLSITFSKFIHVASFHFFLWLNNSSLYGCKTFCLSIHQWRDIWVISIWGLFWSVLLWTVESYGFESGFCHPSLVSPFTLFQSCLWCIGQRHPQTLFKQHKKADHYEKVMDCTRFLLFPAVRFVSVVLANEWLVSACSVIALFPPRRTVNRGL